jgi:hypothetical protein
MCVRIPETNKKRVLKEELVAPNEKELRKLKFRIRVNEAAQVIRPALERQGLVQPEPR